MESTINQEEVVNREFHYYILRPVEGRIISAENNAWDACLKKVFEREIKMVKNAKLKIRNK